MYDLTKITFVDQRNEALAKALLGVVTDAEETLAKFQERFTENPYYAFDWADSAVRAAAYKKVALHYLDGLLGNQEGQDPQDSTYCVEFIKESLLRETLRMAANPRVSTSTCGNYLQQMELSAYAELRDRLGKEFWAYKGSFS
ncbi:hypothetical protein HOU00_gp240 [Caulobacter phage CcrPW]|uniref:Uncharacterized protein n=1 Tax=Caulobacter phage CcrPW TaxID=2283271 RepID=A0A385ED11_9CAUD|nr:hypothetical protein HOU00_gp240 [Caulobacter phage CcrPW]AXQ68885.1 hypothetical protein CcrPW_gp346 [Caulobacter phage CcrPW]